MAETLIQVAGVKLIDGCRVCAHVNESGAFEPETIEAWKTVVESRSIALDIGAYSGLFAIIAAKLGALAIAVEPLPFMAARLLNNARRNNVNVEVILGAASNAIGNAIIHFNGKVPMTSGASLTRGSSHNNVMMVETFTIDSRLPFVAPVRAIKIDVERHERSVIIGARETIKQHKPAIIIELLDRYELSNILHVMPIPYKAGKVLDDRNFMLVPE